MRRPLFLFILYRLLIGALAVSIDNDLMGEPDIECMEHEIRVYIKTRKTFSGRIYAKGKADDPACAKDDFAQLHTKKPRFDLPLGVCGMKSLRSMEPRGMYYGITLVVSFHPLFITKVDQAFHVKCFFEEANKGLTAELGVSMIPTTEVEAKHGIPGCTYSIHRSSIEDLDAGRPAGTAIQFAKVGDKVLHQWHCDDDMFGILLKNCYVTDGVNKRAEVIDSRGCPVEQVLITGVRYSSDLQRAYAETSVFKFADRPGVWFFCEIRMCMKKGGMCDGVTPPACATTMPPPRNQIGGSSRNRLGGGDNEEEEEENNDQNGGDEGEGSEGSPDTQTDAPEDSQYTTNEGGDEGEYADTTAPYPPTTKFRSTKTGKKGGRSGPKRNKHLDSSEANPYGGVPSPIAADEEPKGPTVFGPGLSPDKDQLAFGEQKDSGVSVKPQRSEVTTEFETNDDLRPAHDPKPTTTLPSTSRKDYVDYDSDVTIPPTLTDILSNLPNDITAENVQKMFRDSVADRRALLNSFDILMSRLTKEDERKRKRNGSTGATKTKRKVGERIDTMQVAWDSHRMMRDSPMAPDAEEAKLGGQLFIYDLDEAPPTAREAVEFGLEPVEGSATIAATCAISREGLIVLAMSMGSLVSTLIFVVGFLCIKQYGIGRQKLSDQ